MIDWLNSLDPLAAFYAPVFVGGAYMLWRVYLAPLPEIDVSYGCLRFLERLRAAKHLSEAEHPEAEEARAWGLVEDGGGPWSYEADGLVRLTIRGRRFLAARQARA